MKLNNNIEIKCKWPTKEKEQDIVKKSIEHNSKLMDLLAQVKKELNNDCMGFISINLDICQCWEQAFANIEGDNND